MKVREIMSKSVIYAEVPGSRSEVIEIMAKSGKSGLPVVKKGTRKLVGMVTKTDLLRNPDEEQLALLMTRNPVVVHVEDDVKKAVELMLKHGIRRLPVVNEEDELAGIISVADIVSKVIPRLNINEPIKAYYRRQVPAIWDKTPLNIAYEVMRLLGSKYLIALNDEAKLSGILTEEDIVKSAEITSSEKKFSSAPSEGTEWDWDVVTIVYIFKKELKIPPDIRVRDVMVRKVIKVNEYTSIRECARKMSHFNIDQLPVLDVKGKLIGVIEDKDLLSAVFKVL
ncbi:MAG: inosine-5-monophosphate dehydrogenase [Thermoprotei archaeon]|nr:MAG: inosine-5-monophosphate dehydrogenase [Thermoprotei archaeon]RLF00590.1 MAG: inosine-5-monophosphate dehydrogenase [Thermoprotei archaeon]HDI74343.1 CBS domain-containing protein [Thermoprotei archaeon]